MSSSFILGIDAHVLDGLLENSHPLLKGDQGPRVDARLCLLHQVNLVPHVWALHGSRHANPDRQKQVLPLLVKVLAHLLDEALEALGLGLHELLQLSRDKVAVHDVLGHVIEAALDALLGLPVRQSGLERKTQKGLKLLYALVQGDEGLLEYLHRLRHDHPGLLGVRTRQNALLHPQVRQPPLEVTRVELPDVLRVHPVQLLLVEDGGALRDPP
mmetsp:Transcript_12419/g.34551  ORF Transcript_12419/g.34551 Transcript_12419/m.34551 type:complete len:214 (-) Transcript_12419:1501-2142(-)